MGESADVLRRAADVIFAELGVTLQDDRICRDLHDLADFLDEGES